ncbi:PadR family transcriptional regulator [Rhodococcoides fascians A21d2]|uniref:PadR family transcriptional regulator n=1 Tax=Rhodococcoides fascians TaxID=1828 RepID=UPI0009B85186|nr:PadR family transcriptional regulator [Rhodococcus fascians]QII02197.1 PadR family transcriptional regulator [Rhodococcus fascians A21d2]
MRGDAVNLLGVSVLALLSEAPMHPYEMYQLLLERKEDRIVKIRPGSLYHAVARLHGQELIAEVGTDRGGNRPERTTYEITPAGRQVLVDRLAEILRSPVREYPQFTLGLSEMHNLPASEAIALLRARIEDLAREIEELSGFQRLARERKTSEIYWAGIDYTYHMLAAEVKWLTSYIDRLDSGELEWPHAISAQHTTLTDRHRPHDPDTSGHCHTTPTPRGTRRTL